MSGRPDLSVTVAGIELAVPILAASGTCGSGLEIAPFVESGSLGAVIPKSVTLEPRAGNPNPRLWETPCGLLNSIGLQNEGIEAFLRDLPAVASMGIPVVTSIAGFSVEEFGLLARKLDGRDEIAAMELNISCPNVKKGGMAFGADPRAAAAAVRAARENTSKPLIAKLSPNVTDIVAVAEAVRAAGADALTVMNTLLGMAVDARTRRPRLANLYGGLSGPAVKPVALRMVHQVHSALPGVPIIGCGGVSSGLDVVEFMLCGASAAQVGTAALADPSAPDRILAELEQYCIEHGIAAVRELTGALEPG